MNEITLKVAAKAVIINKRAKILLLREANTYEEGTNIGRYQIPGGRLDPGESYNEGLKREAKEETGLDVEPLYPLYVGEWKPTIKDKPHHIVAIFTVCKATSEKITLSEEHDKYFWIGPDELSDYDITEPDDEVLQRFWSWNKDGLPS